MDNNIAIKVKDLWFAYDKKPVLEEVNLTLYKGDFFGILGPNGGGKTTLLKLFLGLLKPDQGEIRILGEHPHAASHRVGYVPQNSGFNLHFPISVKEIALMGRLSRARIGRRYKIQDHDKIEDVLNKVGLWEYRHAHVGSLSGGQRQRAFIARALATDPEILFLDEPTSNVDHDFETNLYDFLKKLNKKVTIVVITHDIGVISSNMKSVACVNRKLIFHEEGKLTSEMLDMAYQCPVDLIAHGIPHRVLDKHGKH